jgi:hypothetical protein
VCSGRCVSECEWRIRRTAVRAQEAGPDCASPSGVARSVVSLQTRTVSRINVTLCTIAPQPQTVTYSYRTARGLTELCVEDPVACTRARLHVPPMTLYTRDGSRYARGRNGIEFAFMPFFPIRRFARAFGSPFVIQRFGCDHLVTSPRTVAPSPNISSLLPELPGAISVAPCCPCTVLARLWRHKALRGRVIHMICQACIRTYTQRANSSQPTSDVPACATRACSIHALGLLLLDWSRCRAIPEWL